MYNDFIIEAEGELAIGGVTHRLLLALGFDDPDQEDEGMDAEGRRHP